MSFAPSRWLTIHGIAHWPDAVQGPPNPAALRELCRPYASYEAFICGPDPYMTAAKQALSEFGCPRPRYTSNGSCRWRTTEGYILACQSTAVTDQVSIDYT